jgi:SsrA-binding protein
MAKNKDRQSGDGKPKGVRISNRKALRDYSIIEKVEAGLRLTGTEVKSLRAGQAKVDEAYARIEGEEVFLVGANIAQYPHAKGELQHEPTRKRKCLLHRRQIHALQQHLHQKGRTLVPLAMYFKGSWAKVELGVAEGKRQYDKRQDLKKKQHQRDMDRATRRRR